MSNGDQADHVAILHRHEDHFALLFVVERNGDAVSAVAGNANELAGDAPSRLRASSASSRGS